MTALFGRARLLADASARGLEIEVVERPVADALLEAAELLGLETRQIVKSLVVRPHTPDGRPDEYLFVPIPGDRQISWAKRRPLAESTGCRIPLRSSFVEADDLIAAFGATVADISG
jgi:Cys-tRNA(Pro)/Cys-tRNA(Cys) deacylase